MSPSVKTNLADPSLYFNRELSWLEFNERVLEEAQDKTNPVFERLKFLAITASNMDEFFMVRVSGLMDQLAAEFTGRDPSGMTAKEQLSAISERVHQMVQRQYNCLNRSIRPTLEKEKIFFMDFKDLRKDQKDYVLNYFDSTLYPILTPMAIDQSRPFPLLSNKSLNIIVELDDRSSELYAVVQVPSVVSRFLELPSNGESSRKEIIFLEDVIKQFSYKLFNGHKVLNAYTFRITRNSDLTIDEEDTEDLLDEIEKSIKRRKWGEPVRLEIEKNMNTALRRFLETALELSERDIYEISGPLDLTVCMKLASMKGFDRLKNQPLDPVPAVDFYEKDIFEAIREKDILLHHPYDSFDAVVNFVKTASNDPDVLAIKQTLYRVSGNSPIVNALIQAAENGKQVTVLVELKARFDEENNIIWAKKLEKSGCHVIYGLVGLKTHCKLCLVVRRDEDGIRRYIHLGTGNYNDSTAKIYTDMGYFTCKETFGHDISALFNVLTGYSLNLSWNKIAVAPVSLRELFMKYINNEIKNANSGKPARIIAKMNSLVDTGIIQALYKASIAGVKIILVVRGICCLRPGIEGISENIQVVSIVDRFLEHSRIFYFENMGEAKIFLSSADWMPRNLDKRVEIAFPIEDQALKDKIFEMFKITVNDTVKLRIQQPDGTYHKVDRRGKENVQSQLYFHNAAQEKYNALIDIPMEEKLRPNTAPNKEDDADSDD
jgi:polyphosphate kinase